MKPLDIISEEQNEQFLNGADVLADAIPVAAAPEPAKPANPQPAAGPVKIALKRPLLVDGETVSEITLDFENISPADMANIEMEMAQDGVMVPKNAALSGTYCIYVAARAAGLTYADLSNLHLKDYGQIVRETQNFMLVSA